MKRALLALAVIAALAPGASAGPPRKPVFRVQRGEIGQPRSHDLVLYADGTWRVDDAGTVRKGKLSKRHLARMKRLIARAKITMTMDACDAVSTEWLTFSAGRRSTRVEWPCGGNPDEATRLAFDCLDAHTGAPRYEGFDVDDVCDPPRP